MLERTPEDWQCWLEEFSQGENREAWRGIMCFLRWIQIRAQNGHAIPNFLPGLEGDIFHSYLLRRMLEGKEPMVIPPPESYGKPWYELLETGKAEVTDVKPWQWAPDAKMSINEGIWTILEKSSPHKMTVTYRAGGEPFKLVKHDGGAWLLARDDN